MALARGASKARAPIKDVGVSCMIPKMRRSGWLRGQDELAAKVRKRRKAELALYSLDGPGIQGTPALLCGVGQYWSNTRQGRPVRRRSACALFFSSAHPSLRCHFALAHQERAEFLMPDLRRHLLGQKEAMRSFILAASSGVISKTVHTDSRFLIRCGPWCTLLCTDSHAMLLRFPTHVGDGRC